VKRPLALLVLAIMLVGAPPAQAVDTRGSFSVDCFYSHTLPDDPIVFPGQPGGSHRHDFFGNHSTNGSSTYETMVASGTSCVLGDDTAGYWNPTASINGRPVRAIRVSAYYFGAQTGDVTAFPPGLQMLAGNKNATSRAENPRVRWSCIKTGDSPLADHPYNCRPYGGRVTARVDFPSCWDGLGLTPEHMAYTVKGQCPATWVRLPQLSYRVRWDLRDPCAGATPCSLSDAPDANIALHLSSGSGSETHDDGYYTFHADFWNTWQQVQLEALAARCLNQHTKCGKQGV
jgi:hypothetical protein